MAVICSFFCEMIMDQKWPNFPAHFDRFNVVGGAHFTASIGLSIVLCKVIFMVQQPKIDFQHISTGRLKLQCPP